MSDKKENKLITLFEDENYTSNVMDLDGSDFFKLMEETTRNLKVMSKAQKYMRWQYGEPPEFTEFVDSLNNTLNGWVSSNC